MKVSVIIPVYNAAPFLDKSIHSALEQKQTGEVLLIDDRSTDESLVICKKWEKVDSRVKVFVNEGTKGAGAARNVGLRNATCEYIAFLDADDYYLDGRFVETEVLFENNNSIDAVANSLLVILQNIEHTTELKTSHKNQSIIGYLPSFSFINLEEFVHGNSFYITGLTIRRDVFLTLGYFDENLKQTQDTDLIMRLLLNCCVFSGNYDSAVVVYYRHISNTTNNSTEAIFYRRKFAKKHFKLAYRHDLSRNVKWKLFKDYIENDYLWLFGRSHSYKKYFKIILLPFFIFRLISKTDHSYDKDRKIHLS